MQHHYPEFMAEFYKHSSTMQLPTLIIHKHFDNNKNDKGNENTDSENAALFSSVPDPIPVVNHHDQIQIDESVKEYLKSLSFDEQFKRDSQIILAFLSAKDETDPTYAKKQHILRRILIAIDSSESMTVLAKNDSFENEIKIPLGAILLHGASFKFDLPCLKQGEDKDAFFHALIGGKENIASHHVSLLTLSQHQYYGMNLGLGEKNRPLAANGHHGHLYMHWIPPSETKEGHLIVRIYSAEPNKKNRFNELDTPEHHNQFSASGGMRFSTSDQYHDIDRLHAILSRDKVFSLINFFKHQPLAKLIEIDKKIKNHALLTIDLIKTKKITAKIIEYFYNEINIYIEKINDLIADEILNKQKIDTLNNYIFHCKKIKKQLDKYIDIEPLSLDMTEKLDHLKENLNELINNTHGNIANYQVEDHVIDDNTITRVLQSLYSPYNEYSDQMILTQEINITHAALTSKLTQDSLDNLNTLLQFQENQYDAELILLNESIKWVEEAIFSYYLKTNYLETRLTLEHYDLLNKKFFDNIIYYCQLQGYHLTLYPPKSVLINQQDKEAFKHLYQQYEKVLYHPNKLTKIQEVELPTLTISY